jgi:hypothetical protein
LGPTSNASPAGSDVTVPAVNVSPLTVVTPW